MFAHPGDVEYGVAHAAFVVGEEGGAVRCMMRNLEIERETLAAMSLGIARRCVEVMNAYAAERQASGRLAISGNKLHMVAD